MKDDELQIKELKDGSYLLYNKYGYGTKNHSHFKCLKSAEACKRLLTKGIMPNQPYFKSTAKRVLRKEDYLKLGLKRKKERYYNVNNGRR